MNNEFSIFNESEPKYFVKSLEFCKFLNVATYLFWARESRHPQKNNITYKTIYPIKIYPSFKYKLLYKKFHTIKKNHL